MATGFPATTELCGKAQLFSRTILVVNGRSRLGRERYAQARSLLEGHGIRLCAAVCVRSGRELQSAVRAGVKDGATLIIAGGGDGSLSVAAHEAAHTNCVLGVLPLGTGNEFARDLGVPLDVPGACEVIAQGELSSVDCGMANGRAFLNVATLGLSTLIAAELTAGAKRLLGRAAYLVAVARALRRVRPVRAIIRVDDSEAEMETLQVVIGNGRYHAGPFPVAPDASLLSGRLAVYALQGSSRWELLRLAARLPGGHHVELPDVWFWEGARVQVKTARPVRVTVDGEVSSRTPLSVTVAPRSLRVVVPPGFCQRSAGAANRA